MVEKADPATKSHGRMVTTSHSARTSMDRVVASETLRAVTWSTLPTAPIAVPPTSLTGRQPATVFQPG